jgi:outer membrane cobalamin receptor
MTRLRFALALAALISGAARAQTPPTLDKLLGTPVSTATRCENVVSSTAAKYEQTLGSVPASITIITAEEIERYGWTTLDQVLQSVPGFYLTNDRNYVYLGVRGIGRPTDYNTRILVLLNGHDLNEPVLGTAPGGGDLAVDLKTVEKIEIVRGPGSALYGSHAMHAVINVITKSADDMDGLSASARAGSHGDHAGSMRFGRTFGGGLQTTASALWQETNGASLFFPEYGAIARGRDYENLYGFALGLRKGNFSLTASRRSRTKGIPTGSYDSVFDADSWTTNWGDLVAADYHRNIGANKLVELSASWDRTGEHGLWPYEGGPDIDHTFAVRLTGDLQLHWDIRANQRLTLGGQYTNVPTARYEFNTADRHSLFSLPYDVKSWYAEYEYRPIPQLGIVAGIRRDDFSRTADSTNPRAAILFTPTATTTLKLLYGTAFRSPNVYEAYYTDTQPAWRANPDLKPERVHTTELEWEQRLTPEIFVVGSLFHTGVSDLIEQELVPEGDAYWYDNEINTHSKGAELKADFRRRDGVWAYASYSLTSAGMDNSPRRLFKGGLSTSRARD